MLQFAIVPLLDTQYPNSLIQDINNFLITEYKSSFEILGAQIDFPTTIISELA